LAWQFDLARELGCSRIICLADGVHEELDALSEEVREAGLEFHTISRPLTLVGLLSGDHELVVIEDGLIADSARAVASLRQEQGVLTLPEKVGLDAGFERIDAEHAWGGILVARATIAEPLADMPQDCDTISLLLRLALQSGTGLRPLAPELLEDGEWLLVRDMRMLERREQVLLDASVGRATWWAPSIALSRRLSRWLAPEGLERGPLIAGIIAVIAFTGSVLAAVQGVLPLAFGGVGLGAFALSCGEGMARLRARLWGTDLRPINAAIWNNALIDFLLIVHLAWPLSLESVSSQLFIPIVLIGLLRLGSKIWPAPHARLLDDRALLAVILVPAAILGVTVEVIAGLILFVLASCLHLCARLRVTHT